MARSFWALVFACLLWQPAWSADLTATGYRARTRVHVDVYPRRVELVYPRDVTFISGRRFITPSYSCWTWTDGRRLRLVPGWSAPCVVYADWSGSDVRFVEHVRVH